MYIIYDCVYMYIVSEDYSIILTIFILHKYNNYKMFFISVYYM